MTFIYKPFSRGSWVLAYVTWVGKLHKMTNRQVAQAAPYPYSGYHCGNSQDGLQRGNLHKHKVSVFPLRVNTKEAVGSCFMCQPFTYAEWIKNGHNTHYQWTSISWALIQRIKQAFLLPPKIFANVGLLNQIVLYSSQFFFYQTAGTWSSSKEWDN